MRAQSIYVTMLAQPCVTSATTQMPVSAEVLWMVGGAPGPLERGRPLVVLPALLTPQVTNMRCANQHAPHPTPPTPNAPDNQRGGPAKCPRLPRHNTTARHHAMCCAASRQSKPGPHKATNMQQNKRTMRQQQRVHCTHAAAAATNPQAWLPAAAPHTCAAQAPATSADQHVDGEKPADNGSGGSPVPGWFMRRVEPRCRRDQRGPLLQTACSLHAVQLLLNVRGDGLDLCAQLLLNLVPASTHTHADRVS
jgi:hypothetical protein